MAERIRVPDVCRITGMKPRQVQEMAKANEIPSAAQFGRLWTFDGATIRQWAKKKEEPSWETISTDAARERLGGVAFKSARRNTDEAYERLLSPKQRSGSRTGTTRSSTRSSTALTG